MPEITIPLHELYDRHTEVPDVPDCFLVGVWNKSLPKDSKKNAKAIEDGVFPDMPFLASRFDALSMAREGDHENWSYNWSFEENGDTVRLGCNTPAIGTPVFLQFRWGEEIPTLDGLVVLSHIEAVIEAGYKNRVTGKPVVHRLDYCDYCSTETRGGTLSDCRGRRMIALADAVAAGDSEAVAIHLQAVDQWHRVTRSERMRELS